MLLHTPGKFNKLICSHFFFFFLQVLMTCIEVNKSHSFVSRSYANWKRVVLFPKIKTTRQSIACLTRLYFGAAPFLHTKDPAVISSKIHTFDKQLVFALCCVFCFMRKKEVTKLLKGWHQQSKCINPHSHAFNNLYSTYNALISQRPLWKWRNSCEWGLWRWDCNVTQCPWFIIIFECCKLGILLICCVKHEIDIWIKPLHSIYSRTPFTVRGILLFLLCNILPELTYNIPRQFTHIVSFDFVLINKSQTVRIHKHEQRYILRDDINKQHVWKWAIVMTLNIPVSAVGSLICRGIIHRMVHHTRIHNMFSN